MFVHLADQVPANGFVWNPDKACITPIPFHREQTHLGEDAEQTIDIGGIHIPVIWQAHRNLQMASVRVISEDVGDCRSGILSAQCMVQNLPAGLRRLVHAFYRHA